MQELHKILNMPVYGWIMPYSRVLNIRGQRFTGFLNKPPVLNMSGLKIWQGCEYARVTQGDRYA